MQEIEIVDKNIREEICINCKGKGTSFIIRMIARFKALGTILLSILLMVFGWGIIGIIVLLVGVFQLIFAQAAKCKVCEGTIIQENR